MPEARGHRRVAHTADVIVEAWADDLAGCLEEAVAALVEICVETARDAPRTAQLVTLNPGAPEEQLLRLLDEVVFALDTEAGVPVAAQERRRGDGRVEVVLWSVPRDRVVAMGSVPKAIARSELAVVVGPGGVRCRYLVDV